MDEPQVLPAAMHKRPWLVTCIGTQDFWPGTALNLSTIYNLELELSRYSATDWVFICEYQGYTGIYWNEDSMKQIQEQQ